MIFQMKNICAVVQLFWSASLIQVLLYLQKCLEHAAGVTEEDRVKNCILPPVGQYVNTLLTGVNSEGTNIFKTAVVLEGESRLLIGHETERDL